MASLEDAIHDKLAATSAVTDLVSTSIFRGWRPQGSTGDPPCVSFMRVDTVPVNAAAGSEALGNSRIQVDCWASTQVGARAIADAAKSALSGWTNASSPAISPVLLLNDTDIPEPAEEGAGHREHRVSQDYSMWWTA